jgi:cytochrome c
MRTMKRPALILFLLSGAALVAAVGGVTMAAQTKADKSVWDGVYTSAQAVRGKELYLKNCSVCHMEDLKGGEAPALVGEEFLSHWEDMTVDDLFFRIRLTMPQDSPGSLQRAVYMDILTYVLESNQAPPGKDELTESPALKAIAITAKK